MRATKAIPADATSSASEMKGLARPAVVAVLTIRVLP